MLVGFTRAFERVHALRRWAGPLFPGGVMRLNSEIRRQIGIRLQSDPDGFFTTPTPSGRMAVYVHGVCVAEFIGKHPEFPDLGSRIQFQNEFVAAVRPLVLAKFPGTNSGPENQTNK